MKLIIKNGDKVLQNIESEGIYLKGKKVTMFDEFGFEMSIKDEWTTLILTKDLNYNAGTPVEKPERKPALKKKPGLTPAPKKKSVKSKIKKK